MFWYKLKGVNVMFIVKLQSHYKQNTYFHNDMPTTIHIADFLTLYRK